MKIDIKYQRIIGKLIFHADITNISPILMGKGQGEATDKEIMLLPDGQPYIPASSITGCLQSAFTNGKLTPDVDGIKKYEAGALMFWGTSDFRENYKIVTSQTFQSHIVIDDLRTTDKLAKTKIVIRDGVRINHSTNVAENKGKYDYQILEPEVTFHLRAEV
jgi:CRISPR/Cas system CSM-associated protein Csm3 (group 7 of RAMP superfamily)